MAANDTEQPGDTTPQLNNLLSEGVDQFYSVANLSRLEQAIANALQAAIVNAIGAIIASAGGVGAVIAKAIELGERVAAPLLAPTMASMIQSAFGIEVDEDSLRRIRDATARKDLGRTMGATVLGALHSEGGEVTPDQAPAEKLIGMLAHLAMDSWAEGTIFEWIISLSGMLHELEGLTKLAPAVVQATGLDELGRIGLRPLANITVATPLTWSANKRYRPNLLSEGEILKAFKRGDYTGPEAAEELSRLGYSDRRQDMLLKSAVQRLSLDEVLTLIRQGTLDRAYALQNMRDEGLDEQTAQYRVVAAESKRFEAIQDNSLPAVVRAFVNRDISESEFRTYLPAIVTDALEQDSYLVAARTQRGLNVKHLSHGEVIECVELRILSRVDYRRWLEREGYPPEEAAALELRLVKRLNDAIDVEKERAAIAAQRAAEKAAKDAANVERRAQLEAERALHRRGSLGDLERAAIRGLIPLARVEEVLTGQYDADTVAILLDLVEGDRVAFVDAQARAADARKRAELRHIDIGDLERAVLADVLTIGEYRGRLAALGFAADDAAILASTLEARKADLDDARAKRAAAEQAAKTRSIDLGRFERLVRRGVRSFAQYDALLRSLGFDDGARAAMADLLRLDIADDEAARKARDAPKPPPAPKALTLEQARRAVLLDLLSDDWFQTYLVEAGYTSDAQRVLLAELRRDVVDAEAARLKRAAADAASGVAVLALSRVAQAARLGLISPATYQARLVRDGYSDDDIAIEMELLLVEIADTQAARAKRDALAAALDDPKALTLDQIAHAVKAGTQSINDYRFALSQVYGPADVELLARTLEAELAALNDARDRRVTIEGELTARTLSIGDLEAAVKAGALTFVQYRDQLIRWGYGADDAELLTALLVEKLTPAPAGGSGG